MKFAGIFLSVVFLFSCATQPQTKPREYTMVTSGASNILSVEKVTFIYNNKADPPIGLRVILKNQTENTIFVQVSKSQFITGGEAQQLFITQSLTPSNIPLPHTEVILEYENYNRFFVQEKNVPLTEPFSFILCFQAEEKEYVPPTRPLMDLPYKLVRKDYELKVDFILSE